MLGARRCRATARAHVGRARGARASRPREPLRDLRAGADGDPRARDPAVAHRSRPRRRPSRSRSRGTPASRASRRSSGRVVPGAASGTSRPVTSSSGRADRAAVAGHELADRHAPRARGARPARPRASRARRFGQPSAAGDALQTLPTIVARAWICRPPIAERGRAQPVEQRRQVGLGEIRPGRERADPPAAVGRARSPRRPAIAVTSRTSSSRARPTRAG